MRKIQEFYRPEQAALRALCSEIYGRWTGREVIHIPTFIVGPDEEDTSSDKLKYYLSFNEIPTENEVVAACAAYMLLFTPDDILMPNCSGGHGSVLADPFRKKFPDNESIHAIIGHDEAHQLAIKVSRRVDLVIATEKIMEQTEKVQDPPPQPTRLVATRIERVRDPSTGETREIEVPINTYR